MRKLYGLNLISNRSILAQLLMRIAAFFLLLLCWSTLARAEVPRSKSVDILFIGYEEAEALIWIQLLNEWNTELSKVVLTMGAATDLVKDVQFFDRMCI